MEEYRKALAQVSMILSHIPNELMMSIPTSFRKLVEQEKSKVYQPDINELVIENKMLPETVIMLGMIYRDFLCSKEERQKLQEKDKQEYQNWQQENTPTFDYETLFPKQKIEIEKQQMQLVEVKKKWYEKVIDYFRRKIKGEK